MPAAASCPKDLACLHKPKGQLLVLVSLQWRQLGEELSLKHKRVGQRVLAWLLVALQVVQAWLVRSL